MPKPKPDPPPTTSTMHVDNLPTRMERFAVAIAGGLAANPEAGLLTSPQTFAAFVCDLAQALDAKIDGYQS
jgi:hypothetical protein